MVQRLEETGRTGQDGKFRGHFCHFVRRFFAQAGCLGGLGRLRLCGRSKMSSNRMRRANNNKIKFKLTFFDTFLQRYCEGIAAE